MFLSHLSLSLFRPSLSKNQQTSSSEDTKNEMVIEYGLKLSLLVVFFNKMCSSLKNNLLEANLKILHCLFILGEVFVLNDGGEVDLDLGNYERFLDINLYKDNNITTGKIYQHVINKERRGDYLGKTVQGIAFHRH